MAAVGILGGTFDPIHVGHLIIAEAARDQLELDRIEFLPANDPPHKPDDTVSSAQRRAAMIEAAIANAVHFSLNGMELERSGPSYTVDTLELLTGTRPRDEFCFIIGGDSLRDLPSWRSPRKILSLATLAVIDRPGARYDLDALEQALPGLRDRVRFVSAPLIDISATSLRSNIAAGKSVRFQTPDTVIAFISAHGLYR